MEMDRRLFLLSAAASPLYSGPLIWLSSDDSKLIEAICNQIVPPDDAPGAAEAGVVFYIDKQLTGPLKRFQPAYQRGIPLFRSACPQFTSLPFAEQTAFLRSLGGTHPELASFFSMLVDHTMQGYYGSPAHGGNRDEASWKMLDIVDMMGGHRH